MTLPRGKCPGHHWKPVNGLITDEDGHMNAVVVWECVKCLHRFKRTYPESRLRVPRG